MGVPYVTAPCEAEAQCAALAKAGKVYAAASEDMDTLTFRTPILLRHLTFSEQRKIPISEIDLEKVLTGLDMSYEEVLSLPLSSPHPPSAPLLVSSVSLQLFLRY